MRVRKPESGTYWVGKPRVSGLKMLRAVGDKNLMRGAEQSAECERVSSRDERKVMEEWPFRRS